MELLEQNNEVNVILTEHDIHDILCSAVNNLLSELPVDEEGKEIMSDQCGCYDHIKIVPTNPDEFGVGLVRKWEQLMNGLMQQLHLLDQSIHNDAEYTC